MRYDYVQWRSVKLTERQYAAACDEQANKRSPTRLNGLVLKSEKEIYRRKKPICSLTKACIVALI
jgi:hypothetical protein